MNELKHKRVKTNGVELHLVEAGDPEGELIIFLHGFPEFWYGWRKQIEYFAKAGFHVVAPDQRGYNLSDKPKRIRDYRLDVVTEDIVGLIDAFGRQKAVIVGHDWGGITAWWTAVKYPDRIEKLCVLNAPHPTVFGKEIRHNPKQRRKSWYFFFFQIPWFPERRMRKNNWDVGRRALQSTSRKGTFADNDIAQYREAWSQPGSATGMINWYRAMRYAPKIDKKPRVAVPTLLLWGMKDRFISFSTAEKSIALCDNGKLERVESGSHWVQHEESELVNASLHAFLKV